MTAAPVYHSHPHREEELDLPRTMREQVVLAMEKSSARIRWRSSDYFEVVFSAMIRERPDAIVLVTDALTSLNRRRILDFAATRRIPALYEFAFLVKDGGLMSYGPDLADNLRRADEVVQ